MGLTIHYEFSHEGDRSELREKLFKLKSAFAEFQVDARKIFHYEPGELQNESGYGLGPEPGEEKWYYARSACSTLAGSIETERESLGKVGSVERFRYIRKPDPEEVSEDWRRSSSRYTS